MTNLEYYCAVCDIYINVNELAGSNCPYCDTEIPEAAEDENKSEKEEEGDDV